MGGRAVAKKARRRSCVWVAMAAFFARYVTSFPLTSSRAQPGHGLVELSRKFRAEVTRILAFGHEGGWREDHRVVLVGGRHQATAAAFGDGYLMVLEISAPTLASRMKLMNLSA